MANGAAVSTPAVIIIGAPATPAALISPIAAALKTVDAKSTLLLAQLSKISGS